MLARGVDGARLNWMELPSRCVVLGSWSIYFFGCCLVNSCGGMIRWILWHSGSPGKEHHARLVQGLSNWQVWAAFVSPRHRVTASPRHRITSLVSHLCHHVTSLVSHLCHRFTAPSHHRIPASPRHLISQSFVSPLHCTTASPHHRITASPH